jgi:hypothetical protein
MAKEIKASTFFAKLFLWLVGLYVAISALLVFGSGSSGKSSFSRSLDMATFGQFCASSERPLQKISGGKGFHRDLKNGQDVVTFTESDPNQDRSLDFSSTWIVSLGSDSNKKCLMMRLIHRELDSIVPGWELRLHACERDRSKCEPSHIVLLNQYVNPFFGLAPSTAATPKADPG